jgi:hypothetical protein
MAVTPERIQKLKDAFDRLKAAQVDQLKKQQRLYFLCGFCLANWEDDIIYQISYTYGRDLIIEIEKFLTEHSK